jgi:predicted TIM-barrel fold metal-dependent hydrolase
MAHTEEFALPRALQKYGGSILDVDSHEMMPAQVWVREMGDVMTDLADVFLNMQSADPVHPNQVGYEKDDTPIDRDNIWKLKGSRAPGATSIERRLEVNDLTGVKQQLMFPGVGLLGLIVASQPNLLGLKRDHVSYGNEVVRAANDWAVRVAQISDRVRPVVTLFESSPERLIESARRLIDQGIRAVWLPNSIPPGGVSPAHPALDPLWAMLAQKKVALCLHVGLDTKVGGTDVWKEAPAFKGFKTGAEFELDPWTMSSIYLAAQNVVLTMVLGGVFERHPQLRMGVIEAGAFWIGPLSEQLDMFYREDPGGVKKSGKGFRLAHPPSFYIKRNIRVSGFDFEPVGTYITRYGMEDVFCFATDYPHLEGGKDPAGSFYNSVSPLGSDVVEKFFIKNGQWILPA